MQKGEFGKRLKRLREFRKVSQSELARCMSVSRKVIYNYERGCAIDADLADEVLKKLGGIHVMGIDLTPEESRKVTQYIGSLRKQKLKEERKKQNEVFQKNRQKEADQQKD